MRGELDITIKIKMVNLIKQKVSIEHLLPSHRFVPDYLRAVSRRLFTSENNTQIPDFAMLRSITKEASTNIIADVYEEITMPGEANRIWKTREKKQYPNRRSYEYEALVLRWLQERHAPVPALIALLVDITKKDDIRKELAQYFKDHPQALEVAIERSPEKEGIVMRRLREPRHDLDLAYFAGKLHSRKIDPSEKEKFGKLLYKISATALESIVSVTMIGNRYQKVDLENTGFKFFDPLEEDPEYYQHEISKNIERIIVANLIEQGAMNNDEDEISSYKLPAELEERIKKVFAPVVKHLTYKRLRGFVHGETQPFHLAMHESPDRRGQAWHGYHLFDFDKSRIDNVILDLVRYINNPIATLPASKRKNLFFGAVIHAVKLLAELREQEPLPSKYDLPLDLNLSKPVREKLQKFSLANVEKISSFDDCISRQAADSLMKMKDYLSLFTYIELAGRGSKTGYGKEQHKYADLHKRVDSYHNSFLMDGKELGIVEFGRFYEPDYLRRYCAREIHSLLDRMITNNRKTLGYELSGSEVEELKSMKRFFEELKIGYKGSEVPVEYFHKAAK